MATLRLSELAARDVLLVRAIESEDSAAAIVTKEDRRYATAAAVADSRIGKSAGARDKGDFLALRARRVLDRLAARYPQLDRLRRLVRWPPWLSWTLPLAALAVGLASNAIDGRQLNILAFPLLGMLAWNLAVYAWLLVNTLTAAISRDRAPQGHPVIGAVEWLVRPASSRFLAHPTLDRAVSRFVREWSTAAARLTHQRVARTLHIGAAMFALGIVAGLLARARYTTEYSAGWAGTWAGAETEIAALLGILLAPASALTGIALPTAERLRDLRGSFENAGDWLLLWVVTATLFVIVPRTILAIVAGVRAAVLARSLRVEEDFYARSVLRNALGQPRSVRVIPYSFALPETLQQRLARLLTEALGDKTAVRSDPAIPYGGEDEWIAAHGQGLADADHLVLLFNLDSTPEAENHGALARAVRQQVGDRAELMALLDDSGFRHKLRGQASAERRIEERMDAWRQVLAPAGIEPTRIGLDSADEQGAGQALERAMLRSEASR